MLVQIFLVPDTTRESIQMVVNDHSDDDDAFGRMLNQNTPCCVHRLEAVIAKKTRQQIESLLVALRITIHSRLNKAAGDKQIFKRSNRSV